MIFIITPSLTVPQPLQLISEKHARKRRQCYGGWGWMKLLLIWQGSVSLHLKKSGPKWATRLARCKQCWRRCARLDCHGGWQLSKHQWAKEKRKLLSTLPNAGTSRLGKGV